VNPVARPIAVQACPSVDRSTWQAHPRTTTSDTSAARPRSTVTASWTVDGAVVLVAPGAPGSRLAKSPSVRGHGATGVAAGPRVQGRPREAGGPAALR